MDEAVDLVDRKAVLRAIADHNAKYDDLHLSCLRRCIPEAVAGVPSYKMAELAEEARTNDDDEADACDR